jgi:Protein of unknown function (DUF1631)
MATTRPLTPAQIAKETRILFAGEAARALQLISTSVQDRLTALLNESGASREMQMRRDAWTHYQKARLPWQDAVIKAWQAALIPPTATAVLRLEDANFQLVGTDVVENKILSSRLVRGVADKVGSQLDDLKIRMKLLEGGGEMADHDLLKPEVLLLPLVEQWAVVGMQRDAWPMVHDTVLRLLLDKLPAAYKLANDYLVKQGVLATIDLRDRVKRSTGSGILPTSGRGSASQLPEQHSKFGIDAGESMFSNSQLGGPISRPGGFAASRQDTPRSSPGGMPQNAGARAADGGQGTPQRRQGEAAPGQRGAAGNQGYQTPYRPTQPGYAGQPHPQGQSYQPSRQGEAGYQGGSGGGTGYNQAYTHEETRMLTATTPLARARSRAQGVMGQLKRLLVGRGAGEESSGYQNPSPALAAAIAIRPAPSNVGHGDGATLYEDYTPAGVERVAVRLRAQTTELKKKAETKNEKATIEIVALMFQAILQEDRIPPGVRVWFARLQMPVLRVALEEPDFFGTLNHPARQLIDRMGSCVMGFDASGVQSAALEGEIKRVVQVIEQYPETGKRVYQLVYDEFQKFLAKFLTEKGNTQKVVSVAQQVEQKETLTIQYTIEMRNMLKDMPVREEIRDFLFKVWAEVLAVAAVRKGPQHPEALELKKSSSELVWAASAKPNRSDRAKVIADLPKLLQRLRSGMNLLGLAPTQQDAHIKTVSDTLADAFMSKTQAIPQAQIEAMAKRLANLEDFVSEDGMGDLPLDADSIEIMLGIDASTIDVVANGGSKPTNAMMAWAQELQLGAWFTLDHNSRVAKVQFCWRSERKHLNLFASSDGHSYLIQAGRLAAYLQAGLLLPQEEETLTVRATRDALAKLEANPERLLG